MGQQAELAPATAAANVAPARIDYRATLSSREKWTILFGILVMLFLAALDGTIVATAQPAIVRQFQAIDLISWVTSGYLLANTAMVPILGKLSDIYGRKVIMLTSTVVFLVGSCAAGLAPSMLVLILARVVQGIGAAGIMDIAFAAIADLWAPDEQGQISGALSGLFALSSVVGPFLGGWLTDFISWRAVFYVNVPIGIFALIFVSIKMPRLGSGHRVAVDWLGVLLLLATVVPFLFALTLDRATYPWTSPTIVTLLAVTLVALLLFLWRQSRLTSPLLPLRLFRNRIFSLITAASTLFGAAFSGSFVYLIIFMAGVHGVSASKAGATMVPMMLGMVVGAGTSAALAPKVGRYKPFMLGGMLLVIVGLYLCSTLTADTTMAGVTWRMALLGLGSGPMMPLLGLSVMRTAAIEEMGMVTSLRSFFQLIGQMLAVSIFGVILATTLAHQMDTRLQPIMATLPPAFAAQLDTSKMKNQMDAGGGAADPRATATAQIKQAFDTERTLVTRAIRENDATAQAAIAKDPLVPPQLKQLVAPDALAKMPAAAKEQAVTQALAALDQAQQDATVQAQSVFAQVSRAVKESFAAATTPIYLYAMFAAIACLLFLLVTPEPGAAGQNAAAPGAQVAD